MKLWCNQTAIAAFSLILLTSPLGISAAHAQTRAGLTRGTNGVVGCVGNTTQGGCRTGYNDSNGNTFKGRSNYNNTDTNFSNNRNHTWTRNNGNNGNGTVSNNYDKTTKTGARNANRNGTYNGADYTYDKTTTYSPGQVCRTVNGTYGTYTYTNSGKLSCQ